MVTNEEKRRNEWIEHVMRHGGLLVLIIKGYVEGTNCREKPRMKYIKQIMKDQRCNSYEETKRKVSNKGRVENCYKPISGLNTKERERRLQRIDST
ncbi:Uncharacterized protein FWK35_00027027 [Aphis craccivora]|uniref:Uncharacterized protein n=1 Tax=Aphis craccivora TaxID=307492 RepID=A0A6G0ZDF0_APHCR|nr:Uncharacterized protein FWK35_00027027 [Aphis craccivora]